MPTAISALNLLVTAGVSAALYKPFGVAGIVSATALATLASVIAQMIVLRGQLNGIELGSLLDGAIRISVASLVLAAVSWGIWDVLDDAVGRGTIAQIVSLGIALLVGAAVYLGAVLAMRVPEAKQLLGVLRR